MENDKLTRFGNSFQSKVISSLITKKTFIQTISDILQQEYFDSDANKWLVKNIIDYFYEFKTSPTLEVLKIKINDVEDEVLNVSIVDKLKDAWNFRESTDLEFVQKETIKFCKNQKLKNAIIDSVVLLENQDYDGIKKKVDDAMRAGTERDIGHDYLVSLDERLSKSARDTVECGWGEIDEIMDGGLGGGELGVIVAPAGIGKSWALQCIGAHNLRKGKTVVHYSLELNENYVGLRYDTIFTGITTSNIKYYVEDVKKKLKKLPGKLMIKYYPTKSASVQTIASHLKQLELQEINPDIVLVDYADILMGYGKEKRFVLESIYEDLRGLAGEMDIPIWTASQANRSALEEEVIDATKVSEAYSKIMIADFVISMSRKVEDKVGKTARFHIIKNRFGVDGITFPSKMDTELGKIDIYKSTSKQGIQQQKKMNNSEEFLRKTLADKLKIHQKEVEGFE
jgi:archaellum biogenesis ATPase FlaH